MGMSLPQININIPINIVEIIEDGFIRSFIKDHKTEGMYSNVEDMEKVLDNIKKQVEDAILFNKEMKKQVKNTSTILKINCDNYDKVKITIVYLYPK